MTLLSSKPSILWILYFLLRTFFIILSFFPSIIFVIVKSNFLSLSNPKTKKPSADTLTCFLSIIIFALFLSDFFSIPIYAIAWGVFFAGCFQLILNGKPKWPHYGIDIAAKQGTMIKSSGSGIVTMAEDDLYYTGGTIIMDHGHGISTIYSHLENVMVAVGDKINQGDIIGTVGSTGRSTGPHLDFRINWFQTRLDPMSILQ